MRISQTLVMTAVVLLSGCALFSPVPAPVVSVAYPQAQEGVTPALQGSVLQLGSTRLAPWRYAAPECTECQLTVERRDYPEGADLVLALNDGAGRLRWFLVQSQQYRGRLPQGWFEQRAAGVALTLNGGTHLLQPEQRLEHRGCQYQLIEFRRFERRQQPGAIREDARQRMQLVGACAAPG
ncbi:hypothetical protein [Marinobacter sp. X15-166B]|uniref:hypothetical protein n=1 Tax=Marinobacter sp. X15-166B TaxID=1897620 RepID=UPI00085C84CD|nr:hypothetical protein [Marinobacter sp. X15-166B]OEY66492.1 hypothetical protein BG841_08500 [Marinobacter sp. X15-166B]